MSALARTSTLLTLAIAACGGEGPSHADYDAVAHAIGKQLSDPRSGEAELLEDAFELAHGRSTTMHDDFVIECRSATGEALPSCGAHAVIAHLTSTFAGDVNDDARMERSGRVTVQRLHGEFAQLDGASSTRLRTGGGRFDALPIAAIYEGVLIDTTTGAIVWGLIDYTVEAARDDRRIGMVGRVTIEQDRRANLVLDHGPRYGVQLDAD